MAVLTGLVFLLISHTLKNVRNLFSLTFPDFQRQMEWCYELFLQKCPWKPKNGNLWHSASLDFLICRKFAALWYIKIKIWFEVQNVLVVDTTSEIDFVKSRPTTRRVTRLDGARGKTQVWRRDVRTWGLLKASVLYWRKYLWHCWDFRYPPQWFGASIVVRRTGNCSPPFPPRYDPAYTMKISFHWYEEKTDL